MLLAAGLPPFTWAPSSALVARAGRPVAGTIEPLIGALDLGLLPVAYGDVVADCLWGASICSTEARETAAKERSACSKWRRAAST